MAINGDSVADGPSSARVFAVIELTEIILSNLPLQDLVHMQRTCRTFRDIIRTSKASRRQLFWIPALKDTTYHLEDFNEFQRFITFDNARPGNPVNSFRMWQSSSNDPSDPIRLRFHETFAVLPEFDTSVIDFQDAKTGDLRRQIKLNECERAVEVRLKRRNLMETVERLPGGATLGELYDKLCEMSMLGIRSDLAQAFVN